MGFLKTLNNLVPFQLNKEQFQRARDDDYHYAAACLSTEWLSDWSRNVTGWEKGLLITLLTEIRLHTIINDGKEMDCSVSG